MDRLRLIDHIAQPLVELEVLSPRLLELLGSSQLKVRSGDRNCAGIDVGQLLHELPPYSDFATWLYAIIMMTLCQWRPHPLLSSTRARLSASYESPGCPASSPGKLQDMDKDWFKTFVIGRNIHKAMTELLHHFF